MRITRPVDRQFREWEPGHSSRALPLRTGMTVQLSAQVMSATDAGPRYMGMDPSDPLTYVRPWNPRPGMIALLNFDGAQLQDRTPTGGLQRGSQRRGARGSK